MADSRKVYISEAHMDAKALGLRTAIVTVVVTADDIEQLISNLAVVTKEIGALNQVVTALNMAEKTEHGDGG